MIVSWNGLAISSFARASKILKGETEGIKFNFPVVGCDVSLYFLRLAYLVSFKNCSHVYKEKSMGEMLFVWPSCLRR